MTRNWSRFARADLENIHAYIARNNPAAALRTIQRIIKATDRLEYWSHSGRRSDVEGTFEVVVPGLPYVVVYTIAAATIEIHGVYHTSRDPAARARGITDRNTD